MPPAEPVPASAPDPTPQSSSAVPGAPTDVAHAPAPGSDEGGFLAFPDIAKIVAIVGVLVVHVAAPTNEGYGLLTDRTWFASTVAETATRWCVPVFLMVSGMLLLRPRSTPLSPGQFYRRRAARVAVPLVVWSLAYRVFQEAIGPSMPLLGHVQAVLSGQAYYHLYFLYVIAGLYVLTPLVAQLVARLDERGLRNATIAALGFGFLWSGVTPWFPGTGSNAFTIGVPYVGYLLAGRYLSLVRITPRTVRVAAGVAVVLVVASSFATWGWVAAKGLQEGRQLYGYLTPPVIVLSVCVFLLLRAASERYERRAAARPGSERRARRLHTAGEATFGIYLLHPIFFTLWQRHPPGVPRYAHELVWWVPATIAGLILVSLACTLVLQRIPVLRRLV